MNLRNRSIFYIARMLLVALGAAYAAGAQAAEERNSRFPERPVRLIIPYGPGGGNDVVARIVAQALSDIWQRQVVADNRAGAEGLIGMELAARAPADGYTLVIASTSYLMSLASKKPGIDPLDYLQPVSAVAESPLLLLSSPSFPAQTVQQVIALAKSKSTPITIASAGAGNRLAGALFERMAGISLLQVQYKGTGQALIDVVGGQVPLLISSASPVLAYMKSGRLRALAVGSLSRVSFAPSVPTVAESGVPGYEARVWWGIMAPRATPSALVHDISSDIDKAVQSEDVRKKFSNLGIDVLRAKPEVFSKIVAADYKKWAKIIKELEGGAK